MPKTLHQTVAFLLVPLLISDPATTFALSGVRYAITTSPTSFAFNEQAVVQELVAGEEHPIDTPAIHEESSVFREAEQIFQTSVSRRGFFPHLFRILGGSLILSESLRAEDQPNSERLSWILHLIYKNANKYGIDPLLVMSVIHTETHYEAGATSKKDAHGYMQLWPETAQEIARKLGIYELANLNLNDPEDRAKAIEMINDPEINFLLGCRYLADLRDHYGDMIYALIAYNIGPGKADNLIKNHPEQIGTGPYILNVQTRYTFLQEKIGREKILSLRESSLVPVKAVNPPSERKPDITDFMDTPIPKDPAPAQPAELRQPFNRIESAA
jgi:hypothetical protein